MAPAMVDQVSLVLWRGVGMDSTNLGLAQTPEILARTVCSNATTLSSCLLTGSRFLPCFNVRKIFADLPVPLLSYAVCVSL